MSFSKYIREKIIENEALSFLVSKLKKEEKTIVTLNGSFDLLHPGHLDMLYEASLQADILLVLLNTDDSIKRYKSPNRPFNALEVRQQLIAALEMVNYVSCFDEEDPRAILEKIKPNVHVNGSEYGEDCIEANVVQRHGGRLHLVELTSGFSSSNLIKKIQSCV